MEEMKNAVDCYKLPSSLMENITQINDYSDNSATESYMETTASIIALNPDSRFSDNLLENITPTNKDASDMMAEDALGSTESIIVTVDLDKLLDNLRSSGLKIENLIHVNDSTSITESLVVENSDIIGDRGLEKITTNNSTDKFTENYNDNTTLVYLFDNKGNENNSNLESSKNLTSQFCCENISPISYTKIYTCKLTLLIIIKKNRFIYSLNF